MWIKDPIYGDIKFDGLMESLLDTPEMQRLRRLHQIPFANLVYPGANHTRFEHSIGVYYLTKKVCGYLGFDEESTKLLSIYGLLHDVGHAAFPHTFDYLLESELGKDHEEIGLEIIEKSNISDILKDNGIEPREIRKVFESPKGKAITGDIGTDRMDYLMRDSKYTGVAFGLIDIDRLIRKKVVVGDKIALDISGLLSAEYLLIGRFMMFAGVYTHKTRAIASLMIDKSVNTAISHGVMSINDLIKYDDNYVMYKLLSQDKDAFGIVRDILDRRLYKRVFQKRLREFKNWLFIGGMSRQEMHKIEEEIAEDAGVSPLDVIFYIPRPWFKGLSIPILYKGEIYSIQEVSLISRILSEAQWDHIYVYVATKKGLMDKVKPHAERIMSALEEESR